MLRPRELPREDEPGGQKRKQAEAATPGGGMEQNRVPGRVRKSDLECLVWAKGPSVEAGRLWRATPRRSKGHEDSLRTEAQMLLTCVTSVGLASLHGRCKPLKPEYRRN